MIMIDGKMVEDLRVTMVPVGCQDCMECRKQKARNWSVRLQEEIRHDKNGTFVTLTLNNESVIELAATIEGIDGYERDNEIATIAVRRFLERWRKKYKKSVKHWLITELGHNGTENIHLHGIIFSKNAEDIKNIWKYGYVYIGEYVNNRTINYCVKYSTKIDELHKEYRAKILTSAGIGSQYINRYDASLNKYKENGETNEIYRTTQRKKLSLPIYYRNKIYTDEQREKLWIEKLNKNERWVNGQKIDVTNGTEIYFMALEVAREKNRRLGYKDNEINWSRKEYERQRRNANFEIREGRKTNAEKIWISEQEALGLQHEKDNNNN